MLDEACRRGPVPAVIAAANSAEVVGAACQARDMGILTHSVLVGNRRLIEQAASERGLNLAGFAILDSPDNQVAAERAMELASRGEVRVAVKGQMETSKFLRAALARRAGLRTDRTISHVGVFQVPDFDRLLFITDGGVVLYPTIEQKIEIVENGIEVAHSLGIGAPRVALLAAANSVELTLPVTLEIAQIAALESRWRDMGAWVNGPLTLDAAVEPSKAGRLGLDGPVAGHADVLVAPDVESGNMMAKGITYFAHGVMAGVVVGARVPLVVGSRSDPVATRLACIGAGALIATDL